MKAACNLRPFTAPLLLSALAVLAACSQSTQAPSAAAPEATPPAPAAEPAAPPPPAEAAPAVDPAAAPAATPAAPAAKPKPVTHNKPARQSNVAAADSGSSYKQVAAAPPAAPVCENCGVISAVNEVKEGAKASGVGAVAGAAAGLIVGNQIGDGKGKTLAKIAGAAGGAILGNRIEQNKRTVTRYNVVVKMDNGTETTVTLNEKPTLGAGAAVRVVDGALIAK